MHDPSFQRALLKIKSKLFFGLQNIPWSGIGLISTWIYVWFLLQPILFLAQDFALASVQF